jgi:UrcA family protein
MTHFKSALLLAVGTAAAVATGVAGASTTDVDAPQTVVRYHASDLSTDAGLQQVYAHIRAAAERVCPTSSGSRLPSEATVECRQKAIAQAIEKIPSTRLAALADRSKFG